MEGSRAERGATVVEYALMLALMLGGGGVAIQAIGSHTGDALECAEAVLRTHEACVAGARIANPAAAPTVAPARYEGTVARESSRGRIASKAFGSVTRR